MRQIIVLGLFFISLSCLTKKKAIVQKEDLKGKWCSATDEKKYSTLYFVNDSTLQIGSKYDTVYYIQYKTMKSNLYLFLTDSSLKKSEILFLSKDSIILDRLLDNKGRQTYLRCEHLKS